MSGISRGTALPPGGPGWSRRALLRAALAAGAAACAPAPRAAAPPEPAAATSASSAPPIPAPAAPATAREPDVVRQGNVGTAFSTTIARVRGYFRDVGIDLQ